MPALHEASHTRVYGSENRGFTTLCRAPQPNSTRAGLIHASLRGFKFCYDYKMLDSGSHPNTDSSMYAKHRGYLERRILSKITGEHR